MRYTPHPYQTESIKFMLRNNYAGLFLDPGLGKTSITLASFLALKRAKMVKRMLVIAPLRPALSTWPAEAVKWDDFQGNIKLAVLHGKKKLGFLQDPSVDVHVINPEGLSWLFADHGSEDDKAWKAASKTMAFDWWDMLVVDESTRFKHTSTQAFKLLRRHLDKFRRRYILTGSPSPNGLIDLYGQMYILDKGAALGERRKKFLDTFFNNTGFGGYTYVLKEGAAEDIHKRIAPYVMRLEARDHLMLPDLVENIVYVDLPDKAMVTYREVENILLSELSDGAIVAGNVAAATNKCRQIANGGVFYEKLTEGKPSERRIAKLHDVKTEAVKDIVEELQGQPAFIAYEFQHDLERLKVAFPGAPVLGGGMTHTQQEDIIQAWNAGLIPVLLAQPQSAAHGLNLQGTAAAVIFHSLTFNLETYEQFIRRIWRQGQKKPVVVHNIVARRTVDEAIMRALTRKDQTQSALLDALKAYLGGRNG